MAGVPLDLGGREDVLPFRGEAIHEREGTARDARHDRDRVAGFERRAVLRQVADVLLVHVDIHEIPEAAVLGKQVASELVVPLDEVVEGLTNALRLDLHRVLIARVLPERRRDEDANVRHLWSPNTVLYLSFGPP